MDTQTEVIEMLDSIGTADDAATEGTAVNGQTTVETAPAMETEADASKKDPAFIHMPLTPELLAAARAKAGDEALGPWLQRILAEQLGVALPVKTDGRKRYNSDEAREAAKLASRDKAANLRKALLAAHRARMAKDSVKLAQAEADIAKYS